MASETITRNDLKAIFNEILPPTPSEYKKLLWTNASPTASFAPGNVSLDLSSYDEVEITFVNNTTSGYRYYVPSVRCKVGEQGIVNGVFGGTAVESGVIFVFERVFTVSSDKISFGNAAGCADNNSHAIRNEMGVPIEIYGIKYERVSSPQIDATDYVMEQGISGNWTYRKWNSGVAECFGTHNLGNKAITTAYGNAYYASVDTINFPSGLFTATPNIQATSRDVAGYGTWFNVVTNGTSNTAVKGFTFATTSITTGMVVSIHAIGKWK